MRTLTPHLVTGAIASFGLLLTGATNAAFVIQANGLAAANYSAATGTTNSTLAGAGTLQAPGLTPGVASVYGGEPYTYTYIPNTDLNNITTWTSGTVLNSPAGLFASGQLAGAAGFYNIYHVFPQTGNASGQPTLYDIQVNSSSSGVSMFIASQDQNVNDVTTGQSNGVGIGLWELIGQATVLNPTDTITVTVDTTTSGFVGARTAGILIDYAGPIPEPASSVLLGLGALALLRRRR